MKRKCEPRESVGHSPSRFPARREEAIPASIGFTCLNLCMETGCSFPKTLYSATQAGPIGIYLLSLMYSQRLGCPLPVRSLQS